MRNSWDGLEKGAHTVSEGEGSKYTFLREKEHTQFLRRGRSNYIHICGASGFAQAGGGRELSTRAFGLGGEKEEQ